MADEKRYELGMFVGPCTTDEAETLAEAIMDLPEFQNVYGGAVSISPARDDMEDT